MRIGEVKRRQRISWFFQICGREKMNLEMKMTHRGFQKINIQNISAIHLFLYGLCLSSQKSKNVVIVIFRLARKVA
jgi:hypothetical protein